MNFSTLAKQLHTSATLSTAPLPNGLIEKILETAVWAPNHRYREPWRFIQLENDHKKQLDDLLITSPHHQTATSIREAPTVLIVTANKSNDQRIASDDFAAACCLIENIRLLGVAYGLIVEWNLENYESCTPLYQLAGITHEEKIAGILAIGIRQELPNTEVNRTAADSTTTVTIQHFSHATI